MRSTRSSADAVASVTSGAVVVSLSLLLGCAGWRGEGDTYLAPRTGKRAKLEASYKFTPPPSAWRPLRDIDGVQVAWTQEGLVGLIELHVQCEEQGDSSLEQYTDHLRIDWSSWKVVSQEKARLVDRAALHTIVEAEIDGIPRKHELWVVKKNGCLFDLRYSASPPKFEAGQPDFARVVSGFQFPL